MDNGNSADWVEQRRRKPSRIWCFTLNNWEQCPGIHEQYEEMVATGVAKGFILGKEVGESGTPHLQSVVRFHQPRTFNWVRDTLRCATTNAYPHVEPARYPKKAIEYCKKDGDFRIMGEIESNQGKRTDLEDACRTLLEDPDLDSFKNEYPHVYVKYYKGLQQLITPSPRPIGEKPYVVWLTGPTGSGKTRWCWENYDPDDIWTASCSLQWFDGYHGQSVALLDDFRGHWCKFSFLLKVIDRYRLAVPVKGGFVNWVPKTILITCIMPPEEVYNYEQMHNQQEPVEQLLRRIDEVKTFPIVQSTLSGVDLQRCTTSSAINSLLNIH